MNRALNENRHPVQLSLNLNTIADFEQIILTDRNKKPIGKVIEVDANDFSFLEDNQYLKEIEMFLNQ